MVDLIPVDRERLTVQFVAGIWRLHSSCQIEKVQLEQNGLSDFAYNSICC